MKRFIYIILTVCTMQTINAQNAADYYLPLCLGNYLKFDTPNNPDGWSGRTSYLRIIQTDDILGQTYYLEEGTEIPDGTFDTIPFRYVWLRQDESGNILIGAFGESADIDSATIVPATDWLPNSFLTLGYSNTFNLDDTTELTFDVLSVTATAAGFTDCIQVRETVKENDSTVKIDDRFYAYGIGQVQGTRLLPIDEVHTASLTEYVAEVCTATSLTENDLDRKNPVVYPNPAENLISIDLPSMVENNNYLFVLFNSRGDLIMRSTIQSGLTELSIYQLPAGIYVYEISRSRDKLYSGKFLKE